MINRDEKENTNGVEGSYSTLINARLISLNNRRFQLLMKLIVNKDVLNIICEFLKMEATESNIDE